MTSPEGMQRPGRNSLATDTDMPERPGGFTREEGGASGEKPQRQGGGEQYAQDTGDAGSEDAADDPGAARRNTP